MGDTEKKVVPRCPTCGEATWEVVGKLHAWQVLRVEVDADGNERLVPDGPMNDAGEPTMIWTGFNCHNCGAGTTGDVTGGSPVSRDAFIDLAIAVMRRDVEGEDVELPPETDLPPWSAGSA